MALQKALRAQMAESAARGNFFSVANQVDLVGDDLSSTGTADELLASALPLLTTLKRQFEELQGARAAALSSTSNFAEVRAASESLKTLVEKVSQVATRVIHAASGTTTVTGLSSIREQVLMNASAKLAGEIQMMESATEEADEPGTSAARADGEAEANSATTSKAVAADSLAYHQEVTDAVGAVGEAITQMTDRIPEIQEEIAAKAAADAENDARIADLAAELEAARTGLAAQTTAAAEAEARRVQDVAAVRAATRAELAEARDAKAAAVAEVEAAHAEAIGALNASVEELTAANAALEAAGRDHAAALQAARDEVATSAAALAEAHTQLTAARAEEPAPADPIDPAPTPWLKQLLTGIAGLFIGFFGRSLFARLIRR